MLLKLAEVFGDSTEYHTEEFSWQVNKTGQVLRSLKGLFYDCIAAWRLKDTQTFNYHDLSLRSRVTHVPEVSKSENHAFSTVLEIMGDVELFSNSGHWWVLLSWFQIWDMNVSAVDFCAESGTSVLQSLTDILLTWLRWLMLSNLAKVLGTPI